jgi:hypothetical protein
MSKREYVKNTTLAFKEDAVIPSDESLEYFYDQLSLSAFAFGSGIFERRSRVITPEFSRSTSSTSFFTSLKDKTKIDPYYLMSNVSEGCCSLVSSHFD